MIHYNTFTGDDIMLDQYLQQLKEKEEKLQQLNKKSLALEEQLACVEDDVAKNKEEYNYLVDEILTLYQRIDRITKDKKDYQKKKKQVVGITLISFAFVAFVSILVSIAILFRNPEISLAMKISVPTACTVIVEALFLMLGTGEFRSLKKRLKNMDIEKERQNLEVKQKEFSVKSKELEESKATKRNLIDGLNANKKERKQLLRGIEEIKQERMAKIDPLVETFVEQGMVTDKLEMTPKAKVLVKGQRQNPKQG